MKENYIIKESEHKNKIENLKLKLKTIYLEKAQTRIPEPDDSQIKEYNCNECDYKTNWIPKIKEHKTNCKKTKKRKK